MTGKLRLHPPKFLGDRHPIQIQRNDLMKDLVTTSTARRPGRRTCLSQTLIAACLFGAWLHAGHAQAAGTAKTFNVRDYGATADGTTDDQSAITKTIKVASAWTNAAAGNTATVLLPKGTYAVTHLYGFFAVNIVNMHDLTVQGECTTSSLESCTQLIGAPAVVAANSPNITYNTFFQVVGSQNITIKNFYLDKAVPYFSQGLVKAVNSTARTIDLVPDAHYLDLNGNLAQLLMNQIYFFPDPTIPYWDHSAAACASVYPQTVSDQSCYGYHVLSKQALAGGAWRFTLDKAPLTTFSNGKYLLWKNAGWWYGIVVDTSENTQILNVFYTGGGGPAVHVQRSTGTTLIQNVKVDVPTGSGRLIAATSGFNGGHDRGSVILDHVQVRHTDDDAFHFSAGYYYPALIQSVGNTVLRVGVCYEGDFLPGDRISVWNWATKRERQQAVVVSARVVVDSSLPNYPRQCELTLGTAIADLSGMQTYDPTQVGRPTDANDRIVNLSASQDLTVQNSYLSSMRAHCGIIQMTTLYQNNTCQNASMGGLLVGPDFTWGEGYTVQGARIVNSAFDNVGGTAIHVANVYDSLHPRSATQILAVAPGAMGAPNNSNISVQNVSFTNLGNVDRGYDWIKGMAITVENTDGVMIGGNQYDNGAASKVVVSPSTTSNVVGQ